LTRAVGLIVGLILLVGGLLLGLYGLFALLYGGDSGRNGDTYVKLGGHEIDAGLVGAVALVIAALTVALSIVLLRRPRSDVGQP
jgi:hypothetical protein